MSRRKRIMPVNEEGGRKGERAGKLSNSILDLTPKKREESELGRMVVRGSSDKFSANSTGNSGAKSAQ